MQCIQYCKSYDALSDRASEQMISLIQNKPNATICLATGNTPVLTYRYFVEKVRQRQVDISQITLVKLDEWLNIPLHSPGTCESFLQQHIVLPLGLRAGQLISFQSEHIDETECERITNLIAGCGGLDLCVLGLGKNGHLGLNEPEDNMEPLCHISKLDMQTRQHTMLTTADCQVTHGITLGLKEILNAREIMLLVAGEGKHAAVEKYLTAAVTTALPASFLWLHDNVVCLLDSSHYPE